MTTTLGEHLLSLRSMRQALVGNIELPPGQFFVPNETFWSYLQMYKDLRFVDCGAGNGATTVEATQRGFSMSACDIAHRSDSSGCVMMLDVTKGIPWCSSLWPVICRPDHGGWATEVIASALSKGARAIYVGLPSNLDRDLSEDQISCIHLIGKNVGNAGENFYVIKP